MAPCGGREAACPSPHRQPVVEGLARVAAGLRCSQLLEAAARLTAPFLQQAQQAVAGGGCVGAAPDAASRRALPDSLRLLAAALRHLAPAGDDRGELGSQPAAQVLAQAGPTLRLVAESPAWLADREAVGAVVEVYRRRRAGRRGGRGRVDDKAMSQRGEHTVCCTPGEQ